MNDAELLNLYVERDDHDAFRQLVERHAGMVYGVASRRGGSTEIAEEASQTVFIQLARKASKLKQPERLAGWLHRSVLLETTHLLRKRRREQAGRERFAESLDTEAEGDWNALIPVIDEALNQLPASDRELLLAKYYQGFTYGEIAKQQQRAEATARKQGSRALEKLQRLLVRKGVTVSAVALGTTLKPGLSVACPVGLVEVIEGRVADLASGKGAALTTSLATVAMSSPLTLLVVSALAALLPATLGWGRRVVIETAPAGNVSVRPSILASTRVRPVDADQMPTIDEILAARGTDQLGLLLRWLPDSDAETLGLLGEALSQNLAPRSGSATEERFWALFLQRWLTLDAEPALAFAQETRDRENLNYKGSLSDERLYAWWAQVDPDAALASAKTKSMGLAVIALNGLAAAEPAHALALANTLPAEVAASLDWGPLFENLAKQDPAAAFAAAKNLVHPTARDLALQECLVRLGQQDPQQALSQIDAISSFAAREDAREGILERWFETDVASAVQALESMKPNVRKIILTRNATLAWAKQDPEAAQAWAAKQASPSFKRAAYAGLAVAFAGTDIDRAEEAFRQLDWDLTDVGTVNVRQTKMSSFTSKVDARVSLEHAASQWIATVAATDPGDALRLANSFGDSSNLSSAKQDLSRKWMRDDPKGFERFIVAEEDSPLKTFLARTYAKESLKPDEAIPWAKALGGNASEQTLKDVFTNLAKVDSTVAIEKLPELEGLEASIQGHILERMVSAGEPRPESLLKVADWLAKQPDQEGLFHGYEALVIKLALQDKAAGLSLVEARARGPARGGVIAGILLSQINQEDPPPEIFQAMVDPQFRQTLLPRLAEDWLKKDPEIAKRILSDSELDPEYWKRLLNQHPSRR